MRLTRTTVALALVLGATGLFLTWQAFAQTSTTAGNSIPADNVASFYGTRSLREDPELAKLITAESRAEREVNGLLTDYKGTEDEDKRSKIKTKLADSLSRQFDAQQKRRDLELSRLEARLKKVRALMKKRSDERKVIVDKRLDQLVREAEGLGWAPPSGPRTNRTGFGGGNFGPFQAK